jgi:hypothetical protein
LVQFHRAGSVGLFGSIPLDQRVSCVLCLVTSPVVGSNAHKSLCFLMLLVRLFHVEHSVAVAAGAAFVVPLPWSPGVIKVGPPWSSR